VKKVSSADFALYVANMHAAIGAVLTPYFDEPKRKLFVETLAVVFNITLKSLSAETIQGHARALGQCPRDPLFAEEHIRTGRLSNATVDREIRDDADNIIRLSNGRDDINLRNDRVVTMAHPETVAACLARLQAPQQRRDQDRRHGTKSGLCRSLGSSSKRLEVCWLRRLGGGFHALLPDAEKAQADNCR